MKYSYYQEHMLDEEFLEDLHDHEDLDDEEDDDEVSFISCYID